MTTANQPTLFETGSPKKQGPVECLGLTFENDAARRAHFTELLRQKLQDPAFRQIEGFPIGEDEDILALSDPPYYTACPNPFIEDFISHYGKPYDPAEPYHREPFAADVSEGKNDPIYNAHSYHTKVPHKAIMRYILHYTEPGDVVLDGFCGTGMTGVAAQFCGDKQTVQSLGYLVQPDGTILDKDGQSFSRLGTRRAILNDLSPIATFIAYNYNTTVDTAAFEREARRILREVQKECGWMYETTHIDGKTKGKIMYTVWSDIFICPTCGSEIVFWDATVDQASGKVHKIFSCPACGVEQTKRTLERAWETVFDRDLSQTIRRTKQTPVLINYSVGKKRFEKSPDTADLDLIRRIEESNIPHWFPTNRMPEGDESRRNDDIGITHIHQFYTRRNLWVLSSILNKINVENHSKRVWEFLLTWFTSSHSRLHRLNRYMAQHQRHVGPLSGTLYISSSMAEISPFYFVSTKLSNHSSLSLPKGKVVIETISATQISSDALSSNSWVDYIFTDPPFGNNLMYSELNFLLESWLQVLTNNGSEAIINKVQHKGLTEYQQLMEQCFQEYYRILKPGRWLTVEFHNSQNRVWNSIQESIQLAGFVIADVRTLDKQKGTTKQLTLANATKQDLIISAYKPNGGLEERFKLEAGTEEGAWDFVRTHLRQVPVFTAKAGQVEPIAERMDYLLFDRMVAFHVQRGVMVPLSAAEFYAGLTQRFPKRDEMYFLPDQVAEYDRQRMTVKEVLQLQLFVTDESSAIQWLKQQLTKKPQTFQELQPQFMREVKAWEKYEKSLELTELLEQNFLRYDGQGPVPAQIWGWLQKSATTREEMAGQTPDTADAALRRKAQDRWYVPDPTKAGDLEKLREKALLKEFDEYRESKQKRLKVFRLEAVRAGFKKAWQGRDYATIIQVAEKIPDNVLQEDPKLLMWYDQAITRSEM